jgi:GTP-binding protein
MDNLLDDEIESQSTQIIETLNWKGPVFRISALSGSGLKELTYSIMDFLEQQNTEDAEQE